MHDIFNLIIENIAPAIRIDDSANVEVETDSRLAVGR